MRNSIEEIVEQYTSELGAVRRRFHLLGYIKLALIAVLLLELYIGWRYAALRPAVPAVFGASLLALVVIWFYHVSVHNRLKQLETILQVAAHHVERVNDRWKEFPDDGREFAGAEHPYSFDLDIVGPNSLYQMIRIANTHHGRRQLAADLLGPCYSAEEIRDRQQAVGELSGDLHHAILFQSDTQGARGDTKILTVLESLSQPPPSIPAAVKYLLRWVPIGVTTLFLLSVAAGNPVLRFYSMILCAAQGVFWVAGLPRTNRFLSSAAAAPRVFEHYASAMNRVISQDCESARLRIINERLGTGKDSAFYAMKKLGSIEDMLGLRHNGLLYFLANVFLLWDYRCTVALGEWKDRYGGQCAEWFQLLGEYESLLSLSMLFHICEHTAVPVIKSEPGIFHAVQLGHPLLTNAERVCNDVRMEQKLHIISGSNMSGKTTFLRTVGVNLVLVNAGGPVCASQLCCSRFAIRTSMRIADDLSEGISTFYAELGKIAAIIRDARCRADLFFLIDEIFRGTNSEDRLFGASAVIEELAQLPATGMITTHDLSLCSLENSSPGIANYSFSEHYDGDTMLFDYKMRSGKAKTTNARFLMKQVGIL